ncbi:MAG: hypothetical protein V4489_09125 [Chlamydiota bacterium]
MLNIGSSFLRKMTPSVFVGQAKFSSGVADKAKNHSDRNKVIASTFIGAILGISMSRDGERGASFVAGAMMGAVHGGMVTGLTRFVKGAGASAPFWIWAPSMVATFSLFGSLGQLQEDKEGFRPERARQTRIDRSAKGHTRVAVNGVEIEDPALAKEIAKDSLRLTSGILKMTGGILSMVFGEVARDLESEIKELEKDKKSKPE